MFAYHQIQEHPKLLLAMTGMTRTEFHQLLTHFQHAWDQYVQQHYVDRDDRQRQYGGGKSESTLVTLEDKLLFILYYVKVYPLQEILAFEFGMVQSTANEWIHILSEVLKGCGSFKTTPPSYLISRRWVPLSWRLGFGPCLGTCPSA